MLQKELATALDISPAMVSKLAKRGMPTDTLERAQRWRKRHLEPGRLKARPLDAVAHATPSPGEAETAPSGLDGPPPGATTGGEVEGEDFLAARTRRERAEANMAELRQAEQSGKVISVEAVRAVWAKALTNTRDSLLQIPSRLAPVIAAETDPHTVALLIERELRQALAEMSGVTSEET